MKNLKNYIASLLILGLVSSCQSIPVPQGPRCMILTQSLFCVDTRIEEGKEGREFEISFEEARGYQSAPPEYFSRLESFTIDLIEEVLILRRECDVNDTY